MEQRKIPVLVIEDNEIINEFITNFHTDCKNIDLVIAISKQSALSVLKSRDDFEYAFVDWHLPDWTSEDLIDLIYVTQKNISDIYATSTCDDSRRLQVLKHWATKECDKHFIPEKLFELNEKLPFVN